MGDIVPTIVDGDFLEEDLERLRGSLDTVNDVDLLNAFMDQIAESQEVRWKLLRRKEDHWSPHLNCRAIEFFQIAGYNIYRIRPLSNRLSKYRILYAYDTQHEEIHLLAIVLKRPINLPSGADSASFFNYEPNHAISNRIRVEYDNNGLTRTTS